MDSKIILNVIPKSKKDYTKPTIVFIIFYFLLSILLSYGLLYEPKKEDINIGRGQDSTKAVLVENDSEEEQRMDVEVTVAYKEELNTYIDNVLFFLTFTDTLYTLLGENNIENESMYMKLMNEGSINCVFKKYSGEKEQLSEEIIIKVNNIEKLMESFCKKTEESSSLMLMYKETTDVDKMGEYLKGIREINPEAYNERLLIERICLEVKELVNL